jgi:hypothetical protein
MLTYKIRNVSRPFTISFLCQVHRVQLGGGEQTGRHLHCAQEQGISQVQEKKYFLSSVPDPVPLDPGPGAFLIPGTE